MALFPVPARYFVLIMGGIALMSSIGGNQGGVANTAHLGGLLFGYLYLRVWRTRPLAEIKYRYVKWRMNRAAPEVRRLHRRPQRLGPARALSVDELTNAELRTTDYELEDCQSVPSPG